ncbi:MAG: hypothetical protein U0840_16485 [Gemmataceae bacterium]
MHYDQLKELYHEVIEGFVAASKGEFPLHNPHAPQGLEPGEADKNPRAAAWSYGAHSFQRYKDQIGRRNGH